MLQLRVDDVFLRGYAGNLDDSDGWLQHYMSGLLALMTYAPDAARRQEIEASLARHQAVVQHLLKEATPRLLRLFLQSWLTSYVSGIGRGVAAVLVTRHLPTLASDEIRSSVATLRPSPSVEPWVLQPDMVSDNIPKYYRSAAAPGGA
jgi:hypothetical protein